MSPPVVVRDDRRHIFFACVEARERQIAIERADFALFAELVTLDRFRAARGTGELDVLAPIDDADGPDTHRPSAARTERKKRTRFKRYRLRLHVPSQQR